MWPKISQLVAVHRYALHSILEGLGKKPQLLYALLLARRATGLQVAVEAVPQQSLANL
jgi:hypothetical protein